MTKRVNWIALALTAAAFALFVVLRNEELATVAVIVAALVTLARYVADLMV